MKKITITNQNLQFLTIRGRGIHTLPNPPVKVYSNADLQKKEILLENKEKSGVYRWTNIVSGKTYVGSSVDLSRRLYNYYNAAYLIRGDYMAINRALLKYGYSSFSLEILEYCEPDNVVTREQFYLDLLCPAYNILKTAGSSFGHQHSEETKIKISEARVGHKHSEDTLAKLRARGRPSGSGKPNQKVEVLDKETNFTTIFDSYRAAAIALGIRQEVIKNYFARNQSKPYKGRYVFKKL
jgi:hypothetical protein